MLKWFFSLTIFVFLMPLEAAGQVVQGVPTARTFQDPVTKDYVIDFTSDPVVEQLWLAGRLFEDNIFSKVMVKMVYSSKMNRVYAQAGVSYQEYDDPVDNSSTRTPPVGSDGKYVAPYLPPWTLISQFGARSWSGDGVRHYGAGIQFHAMTMGDGTVGMCLSTAPGVNGETRYSGHNKNGEHLVCQVLIMPNGDMVFGYNTDPNYVPKIMFQGRPYFNSEAPPVWFKGDAWSYIAPDRQSELGGRDAMKVRMLEKVD